CAPHPFIADEPLAAISHQPPSRALGKGREEPPGAIPTRPSGPTPPPAAAATPWPASPAPFLPSPAASARTPNTAATPPRPLGPSFADPMRLLSRLHPADTRQRLLCQLP